MKKVTVVNYGVGNLFSLTNALKKIDADIILSGNPEDVVNAERLILPGVGAFGAVFSALQAKGMDDAVKKFVATGRPMMGICVGMQMLMSQSEEFGLHPGLDLIKGSVRMIDNTSPDGTPHKIPHIGWTEVSPVTGGHPWMDSMFKNTQGPTPYYFVHSFTAMPANDSDRLADAYYDGVRISAAITRDNICGTQFHPEKSGEAGLRVLDAFLTL